MISFGIRNVQDMDSLFRETLRVLKPGGRFAILEFSLPETPVIRQVYLFYFKRVLPLLGAVVAGKKEPTFTCATPFWISSRRKPWKNESGETASSWPCRAPSPSHLPPLRGEKTLSTGIGSRVLGLGPKILTKYQTESSSSCRYPNPIPDTLSSLSLAFARPFVHNSLITSYCCCRGSSLHHVTLIEAYAGRPELSARSLFVRFSMKALESASGFHDHHGGLERKASGGIATLVVRVEPTTETPPLPPRDVERYRCEPL